MYRVYTLLVLFFITQGKFQCKFINVGYVALRGMIKIYIIMC